jgi:hypothetical protein
MLDQKETVNTIEFEAELGATENWFRNSEKAKRDGLEYCEHCGKGMNEGTGFYVRVLSDMTNLIAFDRTDGVVVRIGSTCINKFAMVAKVPATHYMKAGN